MDRQTANFQLEFLWYSLGGWDYVGVEYVLFYILASQINDLAQSFFVVAS